MSDCLFCKIVAGEIPSSKVYEDDVCYAFNDIDPQAPTHFLVVPKAHIGSVSEITADNSAVVAHIFEVIARLTKEQGLDSYRVVSNIGQQAGQSVFHLHFHVLSGRDMTGLRLSSGLDAGFKGFRCRLPLDPPLPPVCGLVVRPRRTGQGIFATYTPRPKMIESS